MKMTEQQVLDNLGICDWRHMTKDKVIGFISAIPDMDPETAKAALAQFPEYVKFSFVMDMTKQYVIPAAGVVVAVGSVIGLKVIGKR